MQSTVIFGVYIPFFILLFSYYRKRKLNRIRRKKRRIFNQMSELIKKYIGIECIISSGSMDGSIKGKILTVMDNWIEVETKKGLQIINTDYIYHIKAAPIK